MDSICQLDNFSVEVSEITGRKIYINESLDKYLISPELNLESIIKASEMWIERIINMPTTSRPPPSLREAVLNIKSCKSRQHFSTILDTILLKEFSDRKNISSIGGHQGLLVDLMLHFWSIGAIAWPAKFQRPFSSPQINLSNQGFTKNVIIYLSEIRQYLDKDKHDDAANFRFILDNLLSRIGILSIGDITPKTFYLTQEKSRLGKLRSTGIQGILKVLRDTHYEKSISWIPEDFGFFKSKMGHLARDENFNWLVSADPKMLEWAKLAVEHLKNNPSNYRKRKSSINNFFMHHLANPELTRNPAEYFNIQKRQNNIYEVKGNQARQTMAVITEFMEEVLFKVCTQTDDYENPILMPGFANPHPKLNYKNVNNGETHREAMPTRLISLAMHILTEKNFAWAKQVGRIKDIFRWRNPSNGEYETIWSPVRTYAILLKLLIPPRTYQVRMLDSGEGDTLRYLGEGKWIKNKGRHSPPPNSPPVTHGVFRMYQRKDGSEGCIFYFNTNKTADIENIVKGYVMPWEKNDALQLLVTLRDWQEKYNPVLSSTNWTDIIELQRVKHKDDLMKMGNNFFLFRDPCSQNRPDLPVTDVRLRNLWLKLMEEMEIRLAKSGEKLSNGEPIKLILTRDKQGQPASAAFDLHSLRVSIITAMYEEGVPPRIFNENCWSRFCIDDSLLHENNDRSVKPSNGRGSISSTTESSI